METNFQRDKNDLKSKIVSKKEKLKKVGKEINEEVAKINSKNIIEKAEVLQNKIEQVKELNSRVDTKPLNDAAIYLKTVPAHPRVRLAKLMRVFNDNLEKSIKGKNVPLIKKNKKDSNDDEITYLKTQPSHPSARLACTNKINLEKAVKVAVDELERRDDELIIVDDNDDDVTYLKTQPSHPRARLAHANKINLEKAVKVAVDELERRDDEPILVQTVPRHPRGRLVCNSKILLEKAAKQPSEEIEKRDRFEKRMAKIKQPKIYLEPQVMRELPNFNTKIIVTKTSLIGRENQIYNGIIKQLPSDNDKYCITYSDNHDAYIVRKEK